MRDRPTGEDLLGIIARIEDGDPSIRLPEDGRYKELMIANARAIAGRQKESGDGPERREREDLARILATEAPLADLNRALAAAIRKGEYDPGTAAFDAVRDHLWRTALERVRESNPKALRPLKSE